MLCRVWIGSCLDETSYAVWQIMTNAQNTKPIGMQKFKGGVFARKFYPQFPNAKVALSNIGVMENDNPSIGHGITPCLEVMANCFVCMHAVDMQNIDLT